MAGWLGGPWIFMGCNLNTTILMNISMVTHEPISCYADDTQLIFCFTPSGTHSWLISSSWFGDTAPHQDLVISLEMEMKSDHLTAWDLGVNPGQLTILLASQALILIVLWYPASNRMCFLMETTNLLHTEWFSDRFVFHRQKNPQKNKTQIVKEFQRVHEDLAERNRFRESLYNLTWTTCTTTKSVLDFSEYSVWIPYNVTSNKIKRKAMWLKSHDLKHIWFAPYFSFLSTDVPWVEMDTDGFPLH